MTLGSIKRADVVYCDVRGTRFFAQVLEVGKRELEVKPVSRAVSYRHVKASQVVGHYRRSKRSTVAPPL